MVHVEFYHGAYRSAPDGGWGWVVVFGSFMLQFLTIGITYTFGVFYVELLDYFQDNRSNTAWIGSIQPALLHFTAIFTGPLINRTGWRTAACIGCLLSVTGLATSALAPNIYTLYVTYGVLTGIGNGLMYMTSMVVVQHYFDEKRAMATGIAVSGSGVGTLAFGLISQHLIDRVGWRWTMVAEAAIMLSAIGFAMVFKVLPRVEKIENEHTPLLKNDEDYAKSDSKHCCFGICNFFKEIATEMFKPSFLKNPVTSLFVLSYFMFTFGYFVPYAYTPDRARQYGLDSNSASFLVSIMGISNAASRVLFGWVGDKSERIRFWMAGTVLTLGGVVSILIFLVTTHEAMIVYCVLFGAFSGCWASLGPVVVVDVEGRDNIERAIGLNYSVGAFGFLIASPLSGWIIDTTGSFDVPFYVVGAMQTFGGILFFLVACFPKVRRGSLTIGLAPRLSTSTS